MALTVTHPFVCALADDPVADAAGEVVPSDWNADHDISVTSLTIATGTITASEPVLDLSQTWNAGAVTFTGIKLNVTNTASAAGSLLADFQVGGVSKASLDVNGDAIVNAIYLQGKTNSYPALLRSGNSFIAALADVSDYCSVFASGFYCTGGGLQEIVVVRGSGLMMGSTNSIRWSSTQYYNGTADLFVERDAAATLALRNSTNAQTFRVYGTYTDSSNYVRASLSSSSTAITLAAETAGTGADNVPVNITPAGTEGTQFTNFAQLTEMTAPAAGAANTARIYAEDNGGGKTRLMVIFASGAAQQIAIEP